jgi:hypothetical protein
MICAASTRRELTILLRLLIKPLRASIGTPNLAGRWTMLNRNGGFLYRVAADLARFESEAKQLDYLLLAELIGIARAEAEDDIAAKAQEVLANSQHRQLPGASPARRYARRPHPCRRGGKF